MPKDDDTPGPTAAELELRASDTDREHVADLLREAAGQGRIDMDELEERLEAVYAAKTYGELVPITRDLPVDGATPRLRPSASAVPVASSGGLVVGSGVPVGRSRAIAIMSGANRGPRWTVPKRVSAFAFWGGSVIDLREARFEAQVTEIGATAIMGGVQVVVPEGVRGGARPRPDGGGHRVRLPARLRSGRAGGPDQGSGLLGRRGGPVREA